MKKRTLFVLLMALTLIMTACGDAATSTPPAAAPAATTAAAPAATTAAAPVATTAAATQAADTTAAAPAATTAASAANTSGKAVTLRYAIWSKSQQPAVEQLVAEFKKTHPNIDVKIELTPNDQYWTKMDAAATGGALPDVFWMHASNFVRYASNNIIVPIGDKVTAEKIDTARYPSQLVNLYTYNSKIYGLPRNYNLIGLWYNKAMFDAAGVAYPDASWDWNKLREVAKKLTDTSKNIYGFAATGEDQTGFWNVIYQNGGSIISDDKKSSGYDKPETIAALKYWSEFASVDKSSPTYQQLTETSAQDLFQSGKVAMMFGGDWLAIDFAKNTYTKDKVNVAPLPQGKKKAVILHGSSNVISAKSPNQAEAWEFVKFLSSREAQDIQSQGGASGPPAARDAVEVWLKTLPQFKLSVFVDQIPDTVLYPHSVNTNSWLSLQRKYIGPMLSGQLSPEEAGKKMAADMNETLAKEGR
jgi:multiple sugar transport system substrate-binding protein